MGTYKIITFKASSQHSDDDGRNNEKYKMKMF